MLLRFIVALKYCVFVVKEIFFDKINCIFNTINFYRYSFFHNYFALVYFIVGVNTVLYLVGISNTQFIVQLGMFAPVKGRFWYDVFPEFLNGTLESKRLPFYFLDEVFVYLTTDLQPLNYYIYYYYCFFLSWVI